MRNISTIMFIIFLYNYSTSQEVFQGQYFSKENNFINHNQSNDNVTFIKIIFNNDKTYEMTTETRLLSKNKSNYYVLDSVKNVGTWFEEDKVVTMIRNFDNNKIQFLISSNRNKLFFYVKKKKKRKIMLQKISP